MMQQFPPVPHALAVDVGNIVKPKKPKPTTVPKPLRKVLNMWNSNPLPKAGRDREIGS